MFAFEIAARIEAMLNGVHTKIERKNGKENVIFNVSLTDEQLDEAFAGIADKIAMIEHMDNKTVIHVA